MRRPIGQFILWLLLAAWFASGIDQPASPVELVVYEQVHALAHFAPSDVTPPAAAIDPADVPADVPADAPKVRPVHPGAAFLALPFYGLGRFTAIFVPDDPSQTYSRTARITVLAASATAAAAIIFLVLSAMNLGLRPWSAMLLCLILALASPLVEFGARLEPPAFGLFAVSLIFFAVSRIRLRHELISLPLLAGLGLGVLPFFDDAYWIAWPFLFIWALLSGRRLIKRPVFAAVFFGPLLGLLLLLGIITKGMFGSFWSFPDGLPFWRHFAEAYVLKIQPTLSFLTDDYLPALGAVLFNAGPLSKAMVSSVALPEALRDEIFLGLFCWFPLMAAGLLGVFSMQNDRFTRSTMIWLFLLFWLVLLLNALSRNWTEPYPFNVGDTAAAWFGVLIGLGFFIEYHLWEMHGLLWKNLLRVVFLAVLLVSLANPWFELAAANRDSVSLASAEYPSDLKPATLKKASRPEKPTGPLPVSDHDAFFLSANGLYHWLSDDPQSFLAAFRPGLKHLSLYGPMLLIAGFLLVLLDWVFIRRPTEDERIARKVETIIHTQSMTLKSLAEAAAAAAAVDDQKQKASAAPPDSGDTPH